MITSFFLFAAADIAIFSVHFLAITSKEEPAPSRKVSKCSESCAENSYKAEVNKITEQG